MAPASSYGNFLISPQSGDTVATKDSDHASSVSEEVGYANYYSAMLDAYGIRAEIAPAEHSAIYRFTYPADQAASLVIDVSRKIGGSVSLRSGSVTVDQENKIITGGGTFGSNWNPSNWEMYFAMEFDGDVAEIGTWDNGGLAADTLSLEKASNSEHFGAYVKFDTAETNVVHVKIAISFVSEEKAREFLDEEIPGFDFDAERAEAEEKWNEVLGLVELGGDVDEETKTKFYTALYQANIQPRDRTEDHGTWDDYYTIWDSWRSVFPFLQLIRPDMVAENINSFIKRSQENGKMSDAYIQGKEYLAGQGGNDVTNIIADAYLKGIEGVDWEAAYEAVKADAENYRSRQYLETGWHYSGTTANNGDSYSSRLKSASATVAFAYNDYSVAMMAKGLGHEEDYQKYIERSKNWLNLWDGELTSSDGYTGFIHKRNSDGTFPVVDPSQFKGYDGTESLWQGYNDDYYEAGIWEGTYSPTFDLPTLVELMGGQYAFADRLEYALSQGYMNFANEPSFQTIWLFCADEVKRPAYASYWVNEYLKRYTDTGYPGDEDNGAMSTMYLFMMSGFFPMSGTNNYYLHGTRLPEITYHLGTGNDFVIRGVNAGGDNIYVQSATWNGEPYNVSKLTWEQISEGGELVFVMGSEPSKWGQTEDAEAPGNVSNLQLSTDKLADGLLTLTWDAASDNEAVNVYRVYSSDSEEMVLDETTLAGTVKGTEYDFDVSENGMYFCIVAEDYMGNQSENPPVFRAWVDDSESPVFAGTLTEDARYQDVGLIRLDWEAASDNMAVMEYRVYKGGTADFEPSDETLAGTTKGLSYMETKAEGTWYYKVCAADPFGNVSDPLSVQVICDSGLTGKGGDDYGVNYAWNAAAAASGQTNANESASKAVDGYTNSKWCCKDSQSSDPNGLWLEVDLGEVCQIDQWVVKHAGEGGERTGYNTKDFKLQARTEDGEWLDIDTVENNTDSTTSRFVPTFESRYVRLYITKAAQDGEANTARIYEFELYHGVQASLFEDSLMKTEGITVAVNDQANDQEGAEMTVDFDLSTKWSCRNANDDNGYYWLEVTFPDTYQVDALHILSAANENADYITRDFSLQVKEDGEWKDVLTVTGNDRNLYYGEVSEKAVGTDWRLLITKLGSENKDNARVYEFHLYGEQVEVLDETIIASLEKFVSETASLDYNKYSKENQTKIREAAAAAENALSALEEGTLTEEALEAAGALADEARTLLAVSEIQITQDKPEAMKAAAVVTSPADSAGAGASVSVTVSDIEAGYLFAGLAVSGADGQAVETEEITENVPEGTRQFRFEMPAGAVTVAASFEADKSAIADAAAQADGKLEGAYTEESWKALEAALENAAAVEADPDAGKADVEDAVRQIENALAGLALKRFLDVDEDAWYHDIVYDVFEKQVMTGFDPEHFMPETSLIRAEAAMIFYRLSGSPETEYVSFFPDVNENDWFAEPVSWALEQGLVTGYEDTGLFQPVRKISREELAVMIYRYALEMGYDTSERSDLSSYQDGDQVHDFARDAMEWAVGSGIITGKYDQTVLDPMGTALRAECAAILSRFTDKYAE